MAEVGLVGYCCPTGLGYENRRMWRRLPVGRWMVTRHPKLPEAGWAKARAEARGRRIFWSEPEAVEGFLEGLDVIVAVERTHPEDLFERARRRGVRCVLLVNPEWCVPATPWVREADLLVARTGACFEALERRGLAGRTVRVPCPLDLEALPFRSRVRARRLVFSNGWGGVHQRKGWPAVREALAARPGLPLTVYSQSVLADVPAGVDSRGAVDSPAQLYREADAAVQPSRFEGVGLAILEAMACGLPVLTTDAAPMSEYVRAALGEDADRWLLPVRRREQVRLWQPWVAHDVDPMELAERLSALIESDIEAASSRVRAYIERVHGPRAWERLWQVLTGGAA